MTNIKIMFFDIDGTLIDPSTRQISPKTREALQQLHNNGILLCIATGRAPASLPDLGDLRFDAFSTFNGSLSYTPNEIIHSNPILPQNVEKLLSNAAAIGRPVSLALRDRLSANGIDVDLADYYRLAELELTIDENFDLARQEPVYQVMLGCRPQDHDAIIQGIDDVKIAISWDRAVDVIPASSGKGSAITHILDYYGLDESQAIAFGDSYNDLEMLQAVGTGIAMGNAAEALKAVADHVCAPVSEDGIYHYCIDHGLI